MVSRVCRHPLICLPGSWLVEQKRNRQMLPWGHGWTPLQDREGDRACAWSSVPLLWRWKAPVRHHSCTMLGRAHSCSQNMLPSSHLILTQLFFPITPVPPIFSLCNSHKGTPSFPGRDRSCLAAAASWCLHSSFPAPGSCTWAMNSEHGGSWQPWEKAALPQHQEPFSVFWEIKVSSWSSHLKNWFIPHSHHT